MKGLFSADIAETSAAQQRVKEQWPFLFHSFCCQRFVYLWHKHRNAPQRNERVTLLQNYNRGFSQHWKWKRRMRLCPNYSPVFSVCFLSAVQISPCKGRTGPSCFCCSASVPAQNTSWPAQGFPALLGCTLPARDRKRYTTVMFCYRSSDLVESSWRTLEGRVIDSEAWKKTFTVPQHTVRNTGDCAGLSSSALRDKTPLSHNCGNTNEGHTYLKTFPSSFVADYAKQSSVSLTVIDGTVWGFPLISF